MASTRTLFFFRFFAIRVCHCEPAEGGRGNLISCPVLRQGSPRGFFSFTRRRHGDIICYPLYALPYKTVISTERSERRNLLETVIASEARQSPPILNRKSKMYLPLTSYQLPLTSTANRMDNNKATHRQTALSYQSRHYCPQSQ